MSLDGQGPRILLVGYNGANNTGSEARLLSIISDVRKVFGQDATITVPTLNEENLRRYLQEDERTRVQPIPSVFFFALRRLVKEHDLIMLVEGSCYMDTWAAPLLWAYLGASKYSKAYGKPCLAYAVDAGKLAGKRVHNVQRQASKVDLLVTRTTSSAARLRGWGVTAPIAVTDDNGFTFDATGDQGVLRRLWPGSGKIAGIAVVDFYLWPVVIRPFGQERDCYRWPYYFSHSRRRRRQSAELAIRWAELADRLVEEHGRSILLIAMEAVDERLAREVKGLMKNGERAFVLSAAEHDASEMTWALRDLDILLTSRYHASVLSMSAGVPQAAVGHDLRLHDLYLESGLHDDFYLDYNAPSLWEGLSDRADRLIREHEEIGARILATYSEHRERAERNIDLLREFALAHGLPVAK